MSGEGRLGLSGQVWELRFLPLFLDFPGKIAVQNTSGKTSSFKKSRKCLLAPPPPVSREVFKKSRQQFKRLSRHFAETLRRPPGFSRGFLETVCGPGARGLGRHFRELPSLLGPKGPRLRETLTEGGLGSQRKRGQNSSAQSFLRHPIPRALLLSR